MAFERWTEWVNREIDVNANHDRSILTCRRGCCQWNQLALAHYIEIRDCNRRGVANVPNFQASLWMPVAVRFVRLSTMSNEKKW